MSRPLTGFVVLQRCWSALCVSFVLMALSAFGIEGLENLEGTVVFSSDRSGPWRIWLVDADGEDLRQLTQGDTDEHDVDPVFNSDGSTVLFSSTRGGSIGIWTIPTEGGDLNRICDGDQAEWSPDEKRIAFRRAGQIWIRTLESGEERAVSPSDWTSCSGPAWRADGESLLLAAQFEGKNAVYAMPTTGGDPVMVYDKKGACEPHFTPDNAMIVYETETNICTILPDGQKNKMVTFQAGVQRFGRASPDGKHIVYCQGVSENGPWELYVVPIMGGYPTKLTDGGSDMNPDWK